MDFLQRTPFFRMLVPLVGGIVVFQYLELFVLSEVIILIAAVFLMFVPFLLTQSHNAYLYRWLFGLGIALLLFVGGYFVAEHHAQKSTFTSSIMSGVFQVEVMDTPTEKPNSVQCRVQVDGCYNGVKKVNIASPSLVYFAKDSSALQLTKGDVLILRTTFSHRLG